MTAPPFNPYEGMLEDDQNAGQHALRQSLFAASKRPDPARWAKVVSLADRTKLPADVVDRNFEAVSQAVEPQQTDYDHLVATTPGLARWLQDPDNATLGRHELDTLARVDRGARLIAEPRGGVLSTPRNALGTGYRDLEAAAGQLAVAYGLASPERAAQFVAEANRRASQLRAQAPAYVGAYDRAAAGAKQRAAILDVLAAGVPGGDGAATVGEVLDLIATAITHPRGFGYHVVESLPAVAPALGAGTAGAETGAAVGSVVPGMGTAVGGVIGLAGGTFVGTAPVSVGAEINAELQKRGVDVTDPEALARAYRDPDLMRTVRGYAERRGLTSAAINAVVAPFAGRLAVAAKTSGAGFGAVARATAADVGIQAAGQTAAEIGGQIAGAKGDLSQVDIHQALQSGVQALGYAVGQEAVGASLRLRHHADPVHAAAEVTTQAAEALRAQRDAQALSEIGAAAREATSTAQVPERLRQLVDVASGGQDAASVYFQDAQWDAYWQSKGASPAKAASDILGDGGKAYYEAKATGAPMAIPLGEYVAKVAPTEHFDGLLNVARTRPDGMSLGEAHEYLQSLPATLQELATEAQQAVTAEAAPDPTRQIGEQVAAQLKNAGELESVAKAQAAVHESFFRTLGNAIGVDPLELFNRYGLRIQRREGPAAPNRVQSLPPEELAARARALREAMEETAAERAALQSDAPADPYSVKDSERDAAAKTAEGEFVYARDGNARIRPKLERVATDGLIDEYARLLEANNEDRGLAIESVIPDENFHTNSDGRPYVGMKGGAVRASGRIKAREKSIARIEAELQRRGVEDVNDRLFRRISGHEMSDALDFSFEQAPPEVFAALQAVQRPAGVSPDVLSEWQRLHLRLAAHRDLGAGDATVQATERQLADLRERVGPQAAADVERYMAAKDAVIEGYARTFHQAAFQGSDAINEETRVARYALPNGDEAMIQYRVDGDELRIGFVGSTGGEGSVGRYVREIARDLRDRTGTTEVVAERISGAKPGRAIRIPAELFQPAYHGSPHIFEKFSLHAIGSGEGAQAYGWGLYFAGNKEVARFYREQLLPEAEIRNWRVGSIELIRKGEYTNYSPRDQSSASITRATLAEQLLVRESDIREAFKAGGVKSAHDLIRKIVDEEIDTAREENPEAVATLKAIRAGLDRPGGIVFDAHQPEGRLYHVEIPEDDTMLLWDEPIDKQPPKVQEAFRRLGIKEFQYSEVQDLDTNERYVFDNAAEAEAYVAELRAMGHEVKHYTDYDAEYVARRLNLYGEAYYEHLSEALGSPEAASRALGEQGVTGIKYLDGSSRSKGEGSYNYVIFDDKLVKIMDFEQNAEGGPRGRIRFSPDGRAAIDLFRSADRSTFLHESGHLFLQVLGDVASDANASAELRADHATILEWLGAKPGEQLTRDQHEQFARGFEAYLMEGRAPSETLRKAFYRFKQWLVSLYQNVRALNVEITPAVRAVFDRLLASQEEIAQAEASERVAPLFDDPQALGMSEAQAQSYSEAVSAAHQAAEEELTGRLMKQLRREESAEWRTLREPIEKEITAQVDQDPVYVAQALLTKGTQPDGSPLGEGVFPIKLDRDAVKEILGADDARRLPRGMTAPAGGEHVVHPDLAADMFGFSSAREMLVALAHAPKRREAIARLTDLRMQELYGERASDEELRAVASASVRNEKRVQVLRKELEYLASDHLAQLKGLVRAVTKKVPPSETVRAEAEKLIGTKTVREITPRAFEVAARRAATEAREALLRGDIDAAFEAKRKELLATEVLRAASRAREAIDDALDEFKDVFGHDSRLAKSRDMDLVNAARAILATFGIGKSDKPPAAYLEQLRRYDPEQAEIVTQLVTEATAAAPSAGADYRNLRFDDFAALRESVQSLWALSRRTRQIEIDGRLVEREQIESELERRLVRLTDPTPRAGYKRAATAWDRTKMGLMGVRSALRRVESWATAIDGGPDGPVRRYVWNPIAEGATAFRVARHAALERYAEIVRTLDGTLRRNDIEAPELGYTFRDTPELLGAMLHTGNESNLTKLLVGRGWGSLDENGVLDRSRWDAFVRRMQTEGVLTRTHYDYLQGVWDLFEELKAPAQRAHKQMYGHYFGEITRQAFTTPFGEYAGGYVPAKADPFIVTDAAIHQEQDAVLHGDNSFMFPTAGRGFTKARVEAYARPLIIDPRLVPSHIDAVLRFTHIEPRVKDVGRIVTSRGLAPALDALDPTVRSDLLVPWLQRAAQQRIDLPMKGRGGRFVDQTARILRSRAGMQLMAVNAVVAAEQITHFPAVLLRVKAGRLAEAFWTYVRQPRELTADIHEKSTYMATRETAGLMEVRKAIDHIMLDPSRLQRGSAWVMEHANFLTRGIQHVMDHATWSAAYDEAISGGASERDAVRQADNIVREVLGAYEPESLSRFETGSPLVRLFSMFYSFYNAKANLLATDFGNTVREMGLRKGAGRLLYIYTFGFMIPAVMGGLIKNALAGQSLDEDGDGTDAGDLLAHFFGWQGEMASRTIPFVGSAVAFAAEKFGHGEPDDILSSPAIRAVESAVSVPADVYHAAHDGITHREITDFFTLVGMLTGTPARPLAKPAGYLHDVSTGRAEPTGTLDFTRGLITGQPGAR